MQSRILAVFSTALVVLLATIGFAGPASAAPAVWVMPDVKDMVLQKAVKDVREATGGAELKLKLLDGKNGQDVINQTNWTVCYQSPAAGKAISQKTKAVTLAVMRFNQTRCWS